MSAAPPRIDINNTYGAALIGALFSAMLYGVTTLQTGFFYIHYPDDRIWNKILVGIVWVLDTIHMILVGIATYHALITSYANPLALAALHWSQTSSSVCNILTMFLVHCFFAIRIFRLSGPKIRWWLGATNGFLALGQFCLGIETATLVFIKNDFKDLREITFIALVPFTVVSVLSEIVIAAALCILLHGKRSHFRRTNQLLTNIMVYAINCCVLTLVVAVAETIAFAVSPHTLWFLALDVVAGKLYANSMLATLNRRHSLNNQLVNRVALSEMDLEQSDATQKRTALNFRVPGQGIEISQQHGA